MSGEDWLDRLDEALSLIADVTDRQKVSEFLEKIRVSAEKCDTVRRCVV